MIPFAVYSLVRVNTSALKMVSLYLFLVSVFVGCYGQQEQNSPLPVTINTTVISGIEGCSTQQVRNDRLSSIRNEINDHLVNTVIPYLDGLSCPYGGAGEWSKITSLDMADPNQQCPSTWRLNTFSGIRGCGRTTSACDSVSYPSNGRTYSRVCGKIIAYQQGSPGAFRSTVNDNVGLEGSYIDGISLTHGALGSRSHIRTFSGALNDFDDTEHICACTNSNPWPYTVPSFIGNNYFCDTGDHDAGFVNGMYYLCLTDRGVVLIVPAASSTLLHGFAQNYHNQPVTILRLGSVEMTNEDVVISMIDIYIS